MTSLHVAASTKKPKPKPKTQAERHQGCQHTRIILVLAWQKWTVCCSSRSGLWTAQSGLKRAAGYMLTTLQQQPYMQFSDSFFNFNLQSAANSSILLPSTIYIGTTRGVDTSASKNNLRAITCVATYTWLYSAWAGVCSPLPCTAPPSWVMHTCACFSPSMGLTWGYSNDMAKGNCHVLVHDCS